MSPLDARSRPAAEIDLSVIRQNYLKLARLSGKAQTSAVVKADAYGHGAPQTAQALSSVGCEIFFVAYPSEGVELRQALGGDATIYILNGLTDDTIPVFQELELRPVINSLDMLKIWKRSGSSLLCALHIDTGMNRLGINSAECAEAKHHFGDFLPTLVMSHLACGDEPDHELNKKQLSRFHEASVVFPGIPRSLSATAGIYLGSDYQFDLTRPGIGLYGGGPEHPEHTSITPAMRLTASVLSVFDVHAGESVGYGATRVFNTPAQLATIGLGYADGFPRSASNAGWVIYENTKCPIVGRVSMDLITIDISAVTNAVSVGDQVEVIGPQAGLESQAFAAGTIGYELTTGLGDRISKSWI